MKVLLHTFFISIAPVIELRGAIPYAVANGASIYAAYMAAVLGNILPLPFVILFVNRVLNFARKNVPILNSWVDWLERKVERGGNKIKNYQKVGLFLFVAIPLPGTGGWTGAMIASFLGLDVKESMFPLSLGVMAAGILVSSISLGAKFAFF